MSEEENKNQSDNLSEQPKKKRRRRKRPYRLSYTSRIRRVKNMLQESYPKVFPRSPEPKVALKIGIHEDLKEWAAEHKVTELEILSVIHHWVRGHRYEEALKTGKRYDLNLNETPFELEDTPNIKIKSQQENDKPKSTVEKTKKRVGRKKAAYPENWVEVHSRWKNKEISFKEAMELTGLKQTTFYKLAKEYATKQEK